MYSFRPNGFERPLTNIERIEVLKGPASSLYGANALACIISLITKKGLENRGLSVIVSRENFSIQNYEALFGASKNNIDLLFNY